MAFFIYLLIVFRHVIVMSQKVITLLITHHVIPLNINIWEFFINPTKVFEADNASTIHYSQFHGSILFLV